MVLDLIDKQAGRPPFNPRQAVAKFAGVIKSYGLSTVIGDAYAGQTFRHDFAEHGIAYHVSTVPASGLYEALEPRLNAREVELLDIAELAEQLAGLVRRGAKVGHAAGAHDDWANACAGAVVAGGRQAEGDRSPPSTFWSANRCRRLTRGPPSTGGTRF